MASEISGPKDDNMIGKQLNNFLLAKDSNKLKYMQKS